MATPETNTPHETSDPSKGNPFIGADPEFTQAIDSARSFVPINETYAQTKERPVSETASSRRPTLRENWSDLSTAEKFKFAGVATGAAALTTLGVAVAPELIDQANGPEFSTETTTFTVEDGQGWDSVADAVNGSEKVSNDLILETIKGDPANIDVVTRGDLHPGDSIVIPTSVEP